MQKSNERGAFYGIAVTAAITALAVILAVLVNLAASPFIKRNADESVRSTVALVFDGVTGYEDLTEDFGVDGTSALYRVISGTGGEDRYCVICGNDARFIVGFRGDGIITAVRALSADGVQLKAGQTDADKELLAQFGGISADAEGVHIKNVSGATVDASAAVGAVNTACSAVRALLGLDGEASEEE